MKKCLPFAFAAILLTASLARAGEPPHTIVAEEKTADVAMTLTARFVTLPDAPSFSAKGAGTLRYTIRGSSAVLKGESIPKLVFESAGPIAVFRKLAIIVEGIPGTTPAVNWSAYPRIVLSSAELRVRAYEVAEQEITESSKPAIDVVLPDLTFSTDRVEVEGEEAKGYVDVEGPAAQLVGKAILPDDPLSSYQELLAGQPVLLELLVEAANPYKK